MTLAHKFGKGIWQYDGDIDLEMFREDFYNTSDFFNHDWGDE
jgi:hypothetical protein